MASDNSFELIKELQRCTGGVPPYNEKRMRTIIAEHNCLELENEQTRSEPAFQEGDICLQTANRIRSCVNARNRRMMLAYTYARMQRIRQMRWDFGPVVPRDVKKNLSLAESAWFNDYSINLANYMKSIGDFGLDLMQNSKPPKSIYIEVRCLDDFGRLELKDGKTVVLKRNTQYLLPRSDCELLIRQGILQHIN